MAYFWNQNTMTPVAVDGQIGPATYKALQFGLGIAADGVWGPVTAKCLQEYLGASPYDGVFGPASIRKLQAKLGVAQDGQWGSGTTAALQAALNSGWEAPAKGGRAPIALSAVTYARNQSYSSLQAVIQAACAAAGLTYSNGWLVGYETISSRESSGDANAVNDYDLNAVGPTVADGFPQNCSRGIVQCIPETFATYHAVGTSNDIYDPVANVAASMLYVVAVYGVAADGSNLAANVQQADPTRPAKGY